MLHGLEMVQFGKDTDRIRIGSGKSCSRIIGNGLDLLKIIQNLKERIEHQFARTHLY